MKEVRYPYINNPLGFKLPEPKPVIHPIITNWEQLTAEDQMILSNIKKVIVSKIGDCNIYLHGSRVNGNWDESSDYDIRIYKDVPIETIISLKNYNYDVEVDISYSKDVNNTIPNGILIY